MGLVRNSHSCVLPCLNSGAAQDTSHQGARFRVSRVQICARRGRGVRKFLRPSVEMGSGRHKIFLKTISLMGQPLSRVPSQASPMSDEPHWKKRLRENRERKHNTGWYGKRAINNGEYQFSSFWKPRWLQRTFGVGKIPPEDMQR